MIDETPKELAVRDDLVPVSTSVCFGRAAASVSLQAGNVDGCVKVLAESPAEQKGLLLSALERMVRLVKSR